LLFKKFREVKNSNLNNYEQFLKKIECDKKLKLPWTMNDLD